MVVFKKFLKEIGVLGEGSTGDARLFEDIYTGWKYAIKKFSPYYEERREEHYNRFVNEIKILAELSHPNIVRFYDFYLYPESKQGYIKMEYVEGSKISEFDIKKSERNWDSIFVDIIKAFEYLEEHKVLHRDIRFENILVTSDGTPKIIDFGFGKKLEKIDTITSTIIETPFSEEPEEIVNRLEYNHRTDIFYLGKLFKNLGLLNDPDFSYKRIVEKMQQFYESQRFQTFREINDAINFKIIDMSFTVEQKQIYLNFAEGISAVLVSHEDDIILIESYLLVIKRLNNLIEKSILEVHLQKSSELLSCFIENDFIYRSQQISMGVIRDFYEMLISVDDYKKRVVVENINTRIRSKPIKYSVPF